MNAVEIEEAITTLSEEPFNAAEFPYSFLSAFDAKATTIKRLKEGNTNKSDIGGLLQVKNIHICVADKKRVTETLCKLRESTATSTFNVKFILTTDGDTIEAEDLESGETVACSFAELPDHFGFFLPLAGITLAKQLRENSFDIRATSRLTRLYVELLKENPDWSEGARRSDMNHFIAGLIFCFFAEDTKIFGRRDLFINTVGQMSERDSSNTHSIISEIFRAMNIRPEDREQENVSRWADAFPYVNGGLFSGSAEVPKFSKIARSYLFHIANLDWTQINPDIFGSMMQAVADDEERGSLGMHYTSVPNILKVLNPLFLSDIREKLEDARDNSRMLLNLRKRISRIRVFDPACGSGNFLVIAYKHLREIESTINELRGEKGRKSEIPLTNFRGIEIRDFSVEISRLALIIAEYQCDLLYLGQKEALDVFLPLDSQNWITCGNALRLDWLSICPPTGVGVKISGDDLFDMSLDQAQIDFENEGGETYICGNPPFSGSRKQTVDQKADLESVFGNVTNAWKNIDLVGAWLWKAAEYNQRAEAPFAFVATNSICQGQQVSIIWNLLIDAGFIIRAAHTSFKWTNLAQNNAGVAVIIVVVDRNASGKKFLISDNSVKRVDSISPYLVEGGTQVVGSTKSPIFHSAVMDYGVYYSKSRGLMMNGDERRALINKGFPAHLIKPFIGSSQFIDGTIRYCLWLDDNDLKVANRFPDVRERIESVKSERLATKDKAVNKLATRPHQFRERNGDKQRKLLIPIHTSESRSYLPIGLLGEEDIVPNSAFALYDPELWVLSILSSHLHLVWIVTVCGKLETRLRYSNTLGWNTFPVPKLTEKNKADLTKCAEDILLAREAHFPKTIADLYDPDEMPANLQEAHARNDEVLERIFIGRTFRNDTERLEKLFELYVKMTKGDSLTNNKKKVNG